MTEEITHLCGLNENNFFGEFPASVALLHHVKNHISNDIPALLLNLRRLYIIYLQDNAFTGCIPNFNQSSLKYLNVSNNRLSGEIPVRSTLIRFNASSFWGNPGLCGEQIEEACKMVCWNSMMFMKISTTGANSYNADPKFNACKETFVPARESK
ncbi:hypothetical protein JHK86_016139 [Glycine max]|nr:hypothetical protein JHK86_016139 [Glycine max]